MGQEMSGYQFLQHDEIYRRVDGDTYYVLKTIDVYTDGNVRFVLKPEVDQEDAVSVNVSGADLVKNYRRVVSRSPLF